ncbi:C-type lectin domain family 4 member F [Danio aesculapii]|uniref:C-type lectin domain family 4 member F n=1 Tax=Danio aesculapii TaxID=1142201 RepID=UPI0024C08712|nr:C-type lectin domain family 4 member F [Danio aesculapii]
MDSVYGNSAIILSTVASSEECSRYKDKSTSNKRVRERRSTSKWTSKRTKVLLLVLGFTLVISLGGLCALWMIYINTLADFNSLKEQLSAQELNSTTLRDDRENVLLFAVLKEAFNVLSSRNQTCRDWLSFYDAQSCNLSVNGWTACLGKLYFFSSNKLNWSSSRDDCVSRGADLVTITSQSEQDFLVSKTTESHWIGLSDLETEGHWVWVNKQTLKETGVQ